MSIKTIHLEDHGQDFLRWDIDEQGNIIDSQPYQKEMWTQFRVTNIKVLVGRKLIVKYKDGRNDMSYTLNYPVVDITAHKIN